MPSAHGSKSYFPRMKTNSCGELATFNRCFKRYHIYCTKICHRLYEIRDVNRKMRTFSEFVQVNTGVLNRTIRNSVAKLRLLNTLLFSWKTAAYVCSLSSLYNFMKDVLTFALFSRLLEGTHICF